MQLCRDCILLLWQLPECRLHNSPIVASGGIRDSAGNPLFRRIALIGAGSARTLQEFRQDHFGLESHDIHGESQQIARIRTAMTDMETSQWCTHAQNKEIG